MKFDLEDRTTNFSKDILRLCKNIRITVINRNIIDQLLRSATSIGANYSEALGGSSKKDFRNKVHICKKEAQETRYWLNLLLEVVPEQEPSIVKLKQESHELVLIFNKIASSSS